MLVEFVNHVSQRTGMHTAKALDAIGIVLNAAERQGAPLAALLFERVPGARTLAACMGAETGTATGVIARLIEQTPGGRDSVAEDMIRSLQRAGLGHREIGALLPAIGAYAQATFGAEGSGHLGDVLASANADARDKDAPAAAQRRSAHTA